jgi:hypothetical protein
MLVVLPLLSFFLLVLGFRRRNYGWRESFLFATIPCGLFVAFGTEVLSAFYWVTRSGIAIAWLSFILPCIYWAIRADRTGLKSTRRSHAHSKPLELSERVGLHGLSIIVALTALTALVSAPNNWDVMEYHLPRVIEWISNHGVQLFPTIDRQQLAMPPFSEYVMLHLDLLYGSDRLVNLVQWFASVGSILGVSLIIQLLGGDRRTQIFGSVLVGTIPTGILGATSAKNDYVLSYWIVVAVYFLIRWRTHQTWSDTLAIAASLSLAVFTKGTAYAFLPFLVLACAATWSWASVQRFLVRVPVIGLLCIAINGPLWTRNYRFSGSIFGLPYFDGAGPVFGRMFANSHITLAWSIANFLRSIALDMAVPSHRINAITTDVLSRCIHLLGVDPNDRGQIVSGQSGIFRPFAINFASRNETMSGNTLHFLLFAAALLIGLIWIRRMHREALWLGAGLVGAFFLYSALLRWSPFNARYQLPVFVVSAVFVALTFSRLLPRSVTNLVLVLLLLASVPPLLGNQARPLVTKSGLKGSILTAHRDNTYFFDEHQALADSFIAAARSTAATGCKSVGVDASLLHYEYPFFALLTEYGGPMKISYAGVDNPTAAFQPKVAEQPCRIVCLGCAHAAAKMREYSSVRREAKAFSDVVVFSPIGSAVEEVGVHELQRQEN